MRIHRGLAALTLGLATATVLTACGSSDEPGGAGDPTSAAEPAAATGELGAENFAQRVISALVAAETMQVDLEISADGQAITMSGPVRVNPASVEMQVDLDVMGMSVELIVVGDQVFLGAGGQYQEMSDGDLGDTSIDGLLEQTDPRSQIEDLQTAIVEVEPAGEEEIEGVTATHYLVTVDPARIDGVEPEEAAALGDSFTYDYWVDDQDRLVRVSFGVQGQDAVVTYSGFGEPVEISAPDPDDLVDGLF